MCNGNNHTFTGTGKLSEGYICDCGLTSVHYEFCPYCGAEIILLVHFLNGYSTTVMFTDDKLPRRKHRCILPKIN